MEAGKGPFDVQHWHTREGWIDDTFGKETPTWIPVGIAEMGTCPGPFSTFRLFEIDALHILVAAIEENTLVHVGGACFSIGIFTLLLLAACAGHPW